MAECSSRRLRMLLRRSSSISWCFWKNASNTVYTFCLQTVEAITNHLQVFWKKNGGLRQSNERNNQESNDKAEIMPRTIFNMVRSMVYASGLSLKFGAMHLSTLPTSWTEVPEGQMKVASRQLRCWPRNDGSLVILLSLALHARWLVNTKTKTFDVSGKAAIIIEKDDEMKGYRVCIPSIV